MYSLTGIIRLIGFSIGIFSCCCFAFYWSYQHEYLVYICVTITVVMLIGRKKTWPLLQLIFILIRLGTPEKTWDAPQRIRLARRAIELREIIGFGLADEAIAEWSVLRRNHERAKLFGDAQSRLYALEAQAAYVEAIDHNGTFRPSIIAGELIELAECYLFDMYEDPQINIELALMTLERARPYMSREPSIINLAKNAYVLGRSHLAVADNDTSAHIETAIANFKKAIDILRDETSEIPTLVICFYFLGQAYMRQALVSGDNSRTLAKEAYITSLQYYTPTTQDAFHVEINMELGNVYLEEEKWEDAARHYRLGISTIETLIRECPTLYGRFTYSDQMAILGRNLAYTLLKSEDVAQAVDIAEYSKSRGLQEKTRIDTFDAACLGVMERRKVDKLREEVWEIEAAIQLEIERNSSVEESLVFRLATVYSELITILSKQSSFSTRSNLGLFDRLEGALVEHPNTAFVVPVVATTGGAVVVISYSASSASLESHVVWLPEFALKDLISIFRQSPRTASSSLPKYVALDNTLKYLWKILLGPLYDVLGLLKINKVVISQSGLLNFFPLHAAFNIKEGKRHYFVDDIEVLYTPTLHSLLQPTERREIANYHDALVVGVSEYVPPLPKLAGTLIEANAVSQLLGVEPLINSGVSTDKVVQHSETASYIHLACHASITKHKERANLVSSLSTIFLGSNETLSTSRLLSLRLTRTRLVVISGCETNLSDYGVATDEMLGFTASFLQAGAGSVIGSYWRVDDIGTALIMIRLYKNLKERRLNVGTALREAQLWLRNLTYEDLLYKEIPELGAGFTHLQSEWQDKPLSARPFEQPYFWAGFACTTRCEI